MSEPTEREARRANLLSANEDKAWIYRVISIQALAGVGTVGALGSIVASLDLEIEEEGIEGDTYNLRMKRVLTAVMARFESGVSTMLEGFEQGGFVLGMRERPFLDIGTDALDDAARARVFGALADAIKA